MSSERPNAGEAAREAIRSARAEIDSIEMNLSAQLLAALLGWMMRWGVWFAVVLGITSFTGRFDWLWPLATVLAAASLVIALASRIYVHQSAARKREALTMLEARLAEEETDNDAP